MASILSASLVPRSRFLAGLAASGAIAAGAQPAGAAGAVNIINTGANDSFALQSLITNRHYFDSVALTANTQNVSDGVKLMAAIVTGASDIAILTGFSQVFTAIENGAAIKLVGSAMAPLSFEMYTANPAIRTIKDLEGKTVGTGAVGALVYMAAAAMLKRYNVDIGKVNFVNIGSSSDVFKAVAAKKVDAGPSQHEFFKLASQYGVRIVGDFAKDLPQFTNQGAFASDKVIAEKRDVLVRTLAAYGKAYKYVNSPGSKQDYIQAYRDGVGKDSDELAIDQWDWIQQYKAYNTAIALSPDRINYMQQLNVQLGVQKAVLPLEKVADMSIARDAARLAGRA
jgi:ABC-type nitrate/sulfonate/bicarbonate transport system substrate-binding protein